MRVRGFLTGLNERLLAAGSMLVRRTSTFPRLYAACWRAGLAASGSRRTVEVDGERVDFRVTTRSEYVHTARLGGERHVLRALLDEVEATDVVWDVGACVGTYACFAARRADYVVAFEPEATNRARLRENLSRNAAPDRWTVSPRAVTNTESEVSLRSEFTEVGGGHHFLADGPPRPGDTRIRTASGDALVREGYSRPDIVKVDVQGAELPVIEGMADTLTTVRTLFVEVHEEKCERYGTTPEAVERTLERAGFGLERLADPTTNRDGVYFLRASRE